jgi:cyclic pyranopterin phosphate synthase
VSKRKGGFEFYDAIISPMETKLTHIDSGGNFRMVDVGGKPDTERLAVARGEIRLKPETIAQIEAGTLKKGDALAVARIAGVMAAKKTAEIIPLCHPLQLTHVDVDLEIDEKLPGIRITASVKTIGKTGVEMEALTAVSVAALTIYDMIKAVEKTALIQNIRLVEKRGGRSGVVLNEQL